MFGFLKRKVSRASQESEVPATPLPPTRASKAEPAEPLLADGLTRRTVTETAFHRAAQPTRAGAVQLELYLLKKRPHEIAVRWQGKRIGSLGASATAYLGPMIEQLHPDTRLHLIAGEASAAGERWGDGAPRLDITAHIPTKAHAARLAGTD